MIVVVVVVAVVVAVVAAVVVAVVAAVVVAVVVLHSPLDWFQMSSSGKRWVGGGVGGEGGNGPDIRVTNASISGLMAL